MNEARQHIIKYYNEKSNYKKKSCHAEVEHFTFHTNFIFRSHIVVVLAQSYHSTAENKSQLF